MKKIIRISLASIFFLTSCGDFLEEEPYSFLSPNNLFATEEGAEIAVVGVYETLSSNDPDILGSFNRGLLVVANFGTDDFNARDNNDNIVRDFDNYTFLPNDEMLDLIWKNLYSGINQATGIIEKLPESDIAADKKAQFIAEAKFLRGLFNFYLVRLFGGVPLVTTEVVSLANTSQPRASIQDVYELIIKDFAEASVDLPGRDATPEGRATKAAALGFLTKVYLTLGSYSKYNPVPGYEWVNTSEAFSNAVDYGEQTLAIPDHVLTNSYADIFDTENSAEIIFGAEMYGASGYNVDGSFVANLFAPQNQGNINASRGGQARAIPTLDLLNKYQEGDTRRTWNIVNFRYRGCDEVPHANTYAGKYRKPCGYDGVHFATAHDIPLLRLADVMLMVAEADAELNGGVATARGLTLINELRTTRYAADVTPEEPTGDFLDFIMDERSRELAYEGQRWFDLVRTNRLIEAVMNVQPILGDPLGKNNIEEHHHLFPVPQNEIDNNAAIDNADQNPGY